MKTNASGNETKFKPSSSMDPRSFVGQSFLDDLEYREPFDLVDACLRESERKLDSGLDEWNPDNLKYNEIYGLPKVLMANIERLICGTSFSEETAIVALIRHSYERQRYNCRLKRWWEAIREAVINKDQEFERPQHSNIIYNFVSEYRISIPDFGSGKKSRKFRMPEQLHARLSKTSKLLGYSTSEYCQLLIMRSLSECEKIQFKEEIRNEVIELHRSLEERIRIIVAYFKALRITPCEKLRAALSEVDVDDYCGGSTEEKYTH